ncbi:MAG: ATP-dependent DNA helicase [Eubacteriales bacterium]
MIALKISVRDLVEFTLRKGSIDFQYRGRSRGVEGTKLHQKIQKGYGVKDQREVSISNTFHYKEFIVTIGGRMDGLLHEENKPIIDEIKTTRVILEAIEKDFNPMHWAQGMVYAFLYAKEKEIPSIGVQLTYCNVDSKETKRFTKEFSFKYLEDYVQNLLHGYMTWARIILQWKEKRDHSIVNMSFPHAQYRTGQRQLIVSMYKTIQQGKKIFFNAPTGTGKTISVLFPALLNLPKGEVEKVFYLTSKNTQKEVVETTLKELQEKKVSIKYCSLTAKEKMCFMEEVQCNPQYCQYALGHFDRINGAIQDIFMEENTFDKNTIQKYARKHRVCPFEYALDLTNWSDVVIGDYNYIFDPRVSLKRYTEEKGNYLFLIDEAHNLVDRSKEMYSATIQKGQILSLKKNIGKKHPLYKELDKMNKEFITLKKVEDYDVKEKPAALLKQLQLFMYVADKWLAAHTGEAPYYNIILSLYFDINNFIRMGEYYDTHYRTLLNHFKNDISVKLYCLDTSMYIAQCVGNGISSIFFSATLLPLPYFMELLGGKFEEDYHMILDSPFTRENMCLMIYDEIKTTYKQRDETYEEICHGIQHAIRWKKGNYFIFFPSYAYMERVYEAFIALYPQVQTIIQSKMMSENERQEFLEVFHGENQVAAFAVMGGIFSESIDLQGEKLIGAIIISVGLPQLCMERDFIKAYYDDQKGKGFQYAYMYPGFNKVMQAVGRVIRSQNDKGMVMLMDERYTRKDYQKLFPKHWRHYTVVKDTGDIDRELEAFWVDAPRQT